MTGPGVPRVLLLLLLQVVVVSLAFRLPTSRKRHVGVRLCQQDVAVPASAALPWKRGSADSYAMYWEQLLKSEYRETADVLRARRAEWSRQRLEASGLAVFGASAAPESDLYGEKLVQITKPGEIRLADRFRRGDILVLRPDSQLPSWHADAIRFAPREVCVVETGDDWLSLGVGRSWPSGLWEARRRPGAFTVLLERAAPQAPLKAQRDALHLTRNGLAGDAAALLTSDFACLSQASSAPPARFMHASSSATAHRLPAIRNAVKGAEARAAFMPNGSQREAIAWALGRRLSLIRGPPGTGKTRTAALLIASATRLSTLQARGDGSSAPPPSRVLAVAHSNGAADVLLSALLAMGVPAVRSGRPASVSPSVRRTRPSTEPGTRPHLSPLSPALKVPAWLMCSPGRTAVALAERHPEVVALRARARNVSLPAHERSAASLQVRGVRDDVSKVIVRTAQVVVCSCIGAHQLLQESSPPFPLVVLDEGSQATEPALICALAAAKAEQCVIVGDTRQLPPTVASGSAELRRSLGTSPMARLEKAGVGQKTLRVQYRMPPELLEHPSRYFYDGLVSCANGRRVAAPPKGFAWPGGRPLCFVHCGHNLEASLPSGGRSNPVEAALVGRIVAGVMRAGDVVPRNVAVIAPYAAQVDELRGALARACRVGTVDSFQGQETDLVVFSATRSNELGDLGFLRDPRRLCVAITRARRGLVMVGDARTLRSSHHWAALIESCESRGCLVDAEELLLSS